MDMHSRREYLETLKERYSKAGREEKGDILDQYCRDTGQARKYVIRKINCGRPPRRRKKRQERYDGEVKAALAKVWEMFDYPCGQRLKPILKAELERLRILGEMKVSDEAAEKLDTISSATIDRKLKHEREALHMVRSRGGPKPAYLLRQGIPIKLTAWDTSKLGYVEVDLVMHCGASTMGECVNTLSATEISTGWWEGRAIMGKSQSRTFEALKEVRARMPFAWKGIDSDNGQEFINGQLYKYCGEEKLEFTRSRPNKKNDNAYIEQKNWTHVRKVLGYLRHDTLSEQAIINDLYCHDLGLWVNFFRPVMKLVSKERIGGHLKRKYDVPQTPYQRLLESGQISEEARQVLQAVYDGLNPAQLRRNIEASLQHLGQVYQRKNGGQQVDPRKKLVARPVTFLMSQPVPVG